MSSISKNTIKRILSDIKQIISNPLTSNGIYYKHDENNMMKGYAMIVGSEDTPYQFGYYFFEIEYPSNYPFSPPKFSFLTCDGITRFNPNFYRSGKCCVSILNTWKGEQWTSCQTLSSILLTISSLFNSKPILNEPGIKENHPDFERYHNIVTFKNLEVAIMDLIENKHIYGSVSKLFLDDIMDLFEKNKYKICECLDKLKERPKVFIITTLYKMRTEIDYGMLYERFKKIIDV